MEGGDKILTAKFSLLCNSKVDPICRQDSLLTVSKYLEVGSWWRHQYEELRRSSSDSDLQDSQNSDPTHLT